jgi:cytochrome c-type biogenesis protein CcmH
MSQFILFAALLACLAIAFAVSALWQNSRRLALALAFGLPLAAAGIYYLKGNPEALRPAAQQSALVAAPKTMEEAVAQLQARLDKDPNNIDGRILLARTYMALEKFDLARDAYAKATELLPDDADLAVEYAEALLRTSSDHRFPANAVEMLNRARAKNPQNQRALFFLGLHQMQSNQPAEAAATWQTLLPLLEPDAAAELRKEIDGARAAAKLPPLPETAVVTGPALAITVQIEPTLADLAAPGDTLFVFARKQGDDAGPPVAARRIVLDKLPLELTLTDADSPMPFGKLSSQSAVQVVARLSKSGNAKAASGDLEADPVGVTLADAKPITLMLSRAVP